MHSISSIASINLVNVGLKQLILLIYLVNIVNLVYISLKQLILLISC